MFENKNICKQKTKIAHELNHYSKTREKQKRYWQEENDNSGKILYYC